MKRYSIIALAVLALAASALTTPAYALDIAKLQKDIDEKGARWTAGETKFSHMSAEEFAQYLNYPLESPVPPDGEILYEWDGEFKEDPPDTLDWRDYNGKNYLTSIKDQHPCGSCATFSTVGCLESRIKIAMDNEFIEPNLAEQLVWSCAGNLMPPATFFHTLGWLQDNGTCDEACFPYDLNQCDGSSLGRADCNERCEGWAGRTYKIDSYKFYMFQQPETFIQPLQNGPIVAGFMVFSDFQGYTEGVYEHVDGQMLGGHAVVIVGYNATEKYWICKNSWSEDWGENGYFRVRWGDSLLDFGYQAAHMNVSYEGLCGQNDAPSISGLTVSKADDAEILFNFEDADANLAGAEFFYAVDGGDFTRFETPATDLTGTDGQASFLIPGEFSYLEIYVKDICGESSNVLDYGQEPEGDDDADDDDADDATDDDVTDGGDDDDDDDGGCGC